MGLTLSLHFQPGSKTPLPTTWPPMFKNSACPLPSNGRVSSGESKFLISMLATAPSFLWRTFHCLEPRSTHRLQRSAMTSECCRESALTTVGTRGDRTISCRHDPPYRECSLQSAPAASEMGPSGVDGGRMAYGQQCGENEKSFLVAPLGARAILSMWAPVRRWPARR